MYIIDFRSLGYSLSGDEQDAHELFQGLLDAIENDRHILKENNEPGSLVDAMVENQTTKFTGIVNKIGEAALPRPFVRVCWGTYYYYVLIDYST